MDALTLADVSSALCPWPCHLWTIASIIIILAAIKYVVQLVVQLVGQSQKTGGSKK